MEKTFFRKGKTENFEVKRLLSLEMGTRSMKDVILI